MALPDVKLKVGEKVADKFTVKKKLGEGSCGQVLLVSDLNNNLLAMKIEARMKSKEDEILKMEIYVLKKLQNSKNVCRFIQSGTSQLAGGFTYCVMTLLGPDLSDLRRRCPNRKMQASSVLRFAIQAVQAVEDMHTAGFIHRDVKPTNMSVGHKLKHTLYLFDFGLARQIKLPDSNGKLKLRDPRKKVAFRGTVRYCSLNVHLCKEQGMHDDLYGVLYSMIELATSTLPWKGCMRKEAEKIKTATTAKTLLQGAPKSLATFLELIQGLTYTSVPNYNKIKAALIVELKGMKVTMTTPFEWEKSTASSMAAPIKETTKDAQGPEMDKGPDNDTNKDVDENAESVCSDVSKPGGSGKDFDIENTLENINEPKTED